VKLGGVNIALADFGCEWNPVVGGGAKGGREDDLAQVGLIGNTN